VALLTSPRTSGRAPDHDVLARVAHHDDLFHRVLHAGQFPRHGGAQLRRELGAEIRLVREGGAEFAHEIAALDGDLAAQARRDGIAQDAGGRAEFKALQYAIQGGECRRQGMKLSSAWSVKLSL
jgi:hypothetical protein